jgi:hypothetical protein
VSITLSPPLRTALAGIALVSAGLAGSPRAARGDEPSADASVPPVNRFEDDTIRLELPPDWWIEGEAGEYLLESDDMDVASLLLLPIDAEATLEARLAKIEEQFLVTGLIRSEASESWTEDDEEVLYRRYRLTEAGTEAEDSDVILLHQYSFLRAEIPVLLQVETLPGQDMQRRLFSRIFETLEIRKIPDPFVFEDPE